MVEHQYLFQVQAFHAKISKYFKKFYILFHTSLAIRGLYDCNMLGM